MAVLFKSRAASSRRAWVASCVLSCLLALSLLTHSSQASPRWLLAEGSSTSAGQLEQQPDGADARQFIEVVDSQDKSLPSDLLNLDVPESRVIFYQPVPGVELPPDIPGNSKVWVITAHLDTRPLYRYSPPHLAFVVGIHKDYVHDQDYRDQKFPALYCHFPGVSEAVTAELLWSGFAHAQPYKSKEVKCALPAGVKPQEGTNTIRVGLSGHKDPGAPAAWLDAELMAVLKDFEFHNEPFTLPRGPMTLDSYQRGEGDFAVCSAVLRDDGYGSIAATFVEWMEHNRVMAGDANVMTLVYAMNPGPYMAALIKGYQKLGRIELFNWVQNKASLQLQEPCGMPWFVQSTGMRQHAAEMPACAQLQASKTVAGFWVYGQDMLIHDCMLRAKGRYRWVVVADFDEFITPRQAPDWRSILNPKYADFRFQNTVACAQCTNRFLTSVLNNSVAVVVAPHEDLLGYVKPDYSTFTHYLWAGTVGTTEYGWTVRAKYIIDPMIVHLGQFHYPGDEVMQHHPIKGFTAARYDVPREEGRVYHVRTHDEVSTALMDGILARLADPSSVGKVPSPEKRPLQECPVGCDAPYRINADTEVDYTMLNVHGLKVMKAVNETLSQMGQVIEDWKTLHKYGWNAGYRDAVVRKHRHLYKQHRHSQLLHKQ